MAREATVSFTVGSRSPGVRYPSRSACSTCWTSCRYVGTPEPGSSRNSIRGPAARSPGGPEAWPAPIDPLSIVIVKTYEKRLQPSSGAVDVAHARGAGAAGKRPRGGAGTGGGEGGGGGGGG